MDGIVPERVLLLSLVLFSTVTLCSGIHFYIHPGERRCFQEDLPTETKITGIARVATGPGDMAIDVWVTTLKGRVLYHRHGTEEGMITFMTPKTEHIETDDDDEYDEDTYRVCLEHQLRPSEILKEGSRRLVSYRLDKAVNKGRLFHTHATVSHTQKLNDRLEEVHNELSSMISNLGMLEQREHRLLERNDRTSGRLSLLAGLSLVVMIATSCIQFQHYRHFFKAKKIC